MNKRDDDDDLRRLRKMAELIELWTVAQLTALARDKGGGTCTAAELRWAFRMSEVARARRENRAAPGVTMVPILIDRAAGIVSGAAFYRAAKSTGAKYTLPVIDVTDLEEADRSAIMRANQAAFEQPPGTPDATPQMNGDLRRAVREDLGKLGL